MEFDSNKAVLIVCIETVLIKNNSDRYYRTITKLRNLYGCEIADCYDKPQYLRIVLNDVYGKDYESIVKEIKMELDHTVIDKNIEDFFNVLEYKL